MIDLIEIQNKCIEEYKKGGSLHEVAKRIGLNHNVVSFLIKAKGEKMHKPFGDPTKVKSLKRTRKLSDAEIQEIKELYCEENYDIFDLACDFNVDPTTVRTYLKSLGVTLRGHQKKLKSLDIEEIKRLYCEEKIPTKQIAFKFNISPGSLLTILKENNIKIKRGRPKNEKY